MSPHWIALVVGAWFGGTAGILLGVGLTQGKRQEAETERDVYLRALLALLNDETDEHPERWAEAPSRLYATLSRN